MNTNSTTISKMMTVKDISEILNVSERSIYRYIHDQSLPCHRMGGIFRFSDSDLSQYLERTKKN